MLVTVDVPALVGLYVTEQLPELRLQLAGLNMPVAVPADVKLTVPVGILGVPVALSVTVTVQVEPMFVITVVGAQFIAATVERPLTATVNDWLPVLVLKA